jgi:hypothetical protein
MHSLAMATSRPKLSYQTAAVDKVSHKTGPSGVAALVEERSLLAATLASSIRS